MAEDIREGNFVAFDLEMTGMDSTTDEIIEIGAVKVEAGRIVDEFDWLINPSRDIPYFVADLTGITEDMIKRAPSIEAIIGQFQDFIGDLPLVAHSATLDKEFLAKHITLHNPVLDTLELSFILLPTLNSRSLDKLAEMFGVKLASHHRASADAAATAGVFLKLLDLLYKIPLPIIREINRILEPVDWPLKGIFQEAERNIFFSSWSNRISSSLRVEDHLRAFQRKEREEDVFWRAPGDREEEGYLDIEEISDILALDGAMAELLADYEYRPQQIEMVQEVCQAFNRGRHLVVEAGTGVGKSFAYLAPAIFWAVMNKEKVVVSTNTKNLQEQLYYKDIPLLKQAIPLPFRSVLLKGRDNYLCLRKWQLLRQEAGHLLTSEERKTLAALLVWLTESESGDKAELSLPLPTGMWSKLSADAQSCLGRRKCPWGRLCYVTNVREKAEMAHIIIINHSLLFTDLDTENSVLPRYEHLIIDEAHNIEAVATEHLGKEINNFELLNLLNSLYKRDRNLGEVGYLVDLRYRLRTSGEEIPKEKEDIIEDAIESSINMISPIKSITGDFFEICLKFLRKYNKRDSEYGIKFRLDKKRRRDPDWETVVTNGEKLIFELGELAKSLGRLGNELIALEKYEIPEYEGLLQDLEALATEIHAVADDLQFILDGESEDFVFWIETRKLRDGGVLCELRAAPIEVGPSLYELIFNPTRTVICTSATLAVGDDFSYMKSRLGLDLLPRGRVEDLALGSPFNYRKQVLMGLPMDIPRPNDHQFTKVISDFLVDLLTATEGKGLILFTSYQMMNSVYERIRPSLEERGIPTLLQGTFARRNLTAQFREDINSVLFGTSSFWEGVDIPGEALQCLVIAKLPFAVPTDPIIQARSEALQRRGLDAFSNYTVPQAVIKFKQGFGRLIRNKTDIGVVIILDNRVLTKSYGMKFMGALPPCQRASGRGADIVRKVDQWMRRSG